MPVSKALFSSKSDDWATPRALVEDLEKRFGKFTLDPCATAENAVCEKFFTKEQDGLKETWTGNVFMNPPYSKVKDWIKWAWSCSGDGTRVVCLVPSRTDTAWFHDYALKYGKIEFFRGRIKFMGAKSSAPFPSCLVIFE